MIAGALLLALLAAPAAGRCPKFGKPDVTVQLPPLGTVDVWTSPPRGESTEGEAVLCDGRHRLLRRLELAQLGPGEVTARRLDPPGWPPLLAVVSDWSRADGITVDPYLLTAEGGRLAEITPSWTLDFGDALCLDRSPAGAPTARLVESLTDECYLCWPKRFRVRTYELRGTRLVLRSTRSTRTTRRKHPDWPSALRELRLPCPVEALGPPQSKRK